MLIMQTKLALVAQLVERVLGKDEVTGSIPVEGSIDNKSRTTHEKFLDIPKKLVKIREQVNKEEKNG